MPFKDPEARRKYMRERYAKLYAQEEFRKAEAQRKAEWFQGEGVAEHRAQMLAEWRKRQKRRKVKG